MTNFISHMPNLNRPTLVSVEKLSEADLDAARAAKNWPQRRVDPLPPMDFQPHQAAHAASEVDDDWREPMTLADKIGRGLIFWGAIAFVGFVGYLAVTL